MVDVVELRHRGEARLEHLHLGEGGDCFDLLRADPVEEAVHQLPPGPEAVARIRPAPLGQAGKGALEGVAVQVGGRGQEHVHPLRPGTRIRVRIHRGDLPVRIDRHAHVAPPPLVRQRLLRPECLHCVHCR